MAVVLARLCHGRAGPDAAAASQPDRLAVGNRRAGLWAVALTALAGRGDHQCGRCRPRPVRRRRDAGSVERAADRQPTRAGRPGGHGRHRGLRRRPCAALGQPAGRGGLRAATLPPDVPQRARRNWSDLLVTSRMLGVGPEGATRIWPAHVAGPSVQTAPDGSKKDRLDDQTDDQARQAFGEPGWVEHRVQRPEDPPPDHLEWVKPAHPAGAKLDGGRPERKGVAVQHSERALLALPSEPAGLLWIPGQPAQRLAAGPGRRDGRGLRLGLPPGGRGVLEGGRRPLPAPIVDPRVKDTSTLKEDRP
jgi:hypothetical protein